MIMYNLIHNNIISPPRELDETSKFLKKGTIGGSSGSEPVNPFALKSINSMFVKVDIFGILPLRPQVDTSN